MDSEYTIRVTGGPPPPLPTAKGGKKGSKQRGGGGGKNAVLAQQQKRYNMRLRPSTSLDQFRRDVFALFNIPSNSTHLYNISFLGGFPPKELDQTDKSTVEQLGIRANESVIVKITLNDSAAMAGNGSSTSNTTSDSKQSSPLSSSSPAAAATTSNNGRQKRAAAEAATASFPELIAAQNEMMKTEQKKKSSNVQSFGSTNNRITTTYSSSSSPYGGGGKKSNKKTKIEGTGYRLSDGKAVEGSNKRKRSTKQQQQPLFKSEDDIAGKLLSSMGSGGGGGGNTGKFLRMAMKGAVEKSYEESRAAVRVAAVNKGAFSFEKVKGGTIVEGTGVVLGTAKDHEEGGDDHEENEILGRTLYMVSYDKGLEGRGRYEEHVEIISEDALKGLIEHVYNTPSEGDDDEEDADENSAGKEMLRPVSMAQLSPRVFWSLVYHYSKANQNEPSANASVETMLQSTMPELDWTHLERGGRKRNRSEKARENWRQKKEAALLSTKSETDEDGVKAIEEMEESILEAAMLTKNDHGDNELSERERRARAAMARFGNGGDTETATKSSISTKLDEEDEVSDDWALVTPTEDDIDELIECIIEGREESETYDEKDAKVWAAALVDNVRNWRGLANADGEVVLSQVNNNDNLQLETIERWIEAAQQRSMEEIMLEILDGDQDALDALQDKAHSSTPKDLSFWYTSPGLLLDTLSKGEDDESCPWSETDVKRWASRAKTALNTLSWLNLYVTPV